MGIFVATVWRQFYADFGAGLLGRELRIGGPGSWLLKNCGCLLVLHHLIGGLLRTRSNERDDLLQVVVQVPREDGFVMCDAIA